MVAHDSRVIVGDHHLPISSLTPAQVEVLAGTVVGYDEVLARIAGRAKAHIDLKFISPDEAYATPGATSRSPSYAGRSRCSARPT